jgi:hypothetical protein
VTTSIRRCAPPGERSGTIGALGQFERGYSLCNPGDYDGHPYCGRGVWWEQQAKCLADLSRGHSAWTTLMATASDAWFAYHDAVFPYWTGLQANIAGPVFHQYLGLLIDKKTELDRWTLVNLWQHQAASLRQWIGCGGSEPGTSQLDVPDMESTPDPEPCPLTLRGLSVTIDLEVLTLERLCEKAEVEATFARFGPVVGFLQGELQNHGEVTLFAGGMFDVEGVGSFDSAHYITSGADGKPADIGWEVGPEIDVGHGVKIKVWEDKIRFSFVAGVRSLYP